MPSGFNCGCTNFVDLYAAHIQHDTGVATSARNEAVAGAVSSDVVDQLKGSSDIASEVARADFVVLNVGANDFADARSTYDAGNCGGSDNLACFRSALPTMRADIEQILARVTTLAGGHPVALRVLDYWNVFEDGEVGRENGAAYVRDSARLTALVDAQICAAAKDQGAVCVATTAAFKGSQGDQDATPLLADDGDHPNARGHQVIAGLLAAAGYAPVS